MQFNAGRIVGEVCAPPQSVIVVERFSLSTIYAQAPRLLADDREYC